MYIKKVTVKTWKRALGHTVVIDVTYKIFINSFFFSFIIFVFILCVL